MSGIVLTFPILASKEETWRWFCQDISGLQQQICITSRRSFGIGYERMTLVDTTYGATAVTPLDVLDVGQTLG
jgi:hypothetical protein